MLRHNLLYIRRKTFTSSQIHLYFTLCLETLSSRKPLLNAQQQRTNPSPAPRWPDANDRPRSLSSCPPAPWRRHDALPRSRPPAAVAARICSADDRATGLSKADVTDDRLALGDHEKRHQRQSSLTFLTPMMLPTPPRDGLLNKITMH